MPVFSASSHQISRLSCALVIASVAQACAPGYDRGPADRAPESSEVAQAVTGGCGTSLTCQARSNCDPWSRFTQGDGLGFHTVSSQVATFDFSVGCSELGGCEWVDWDNICQGERDGTVNSIIGSIPGITGPAAAAFRYQNNPAVNPSASVTQLGWLDEVQYVDVSTGRNTIDYYRCYNPIDGIPGPDNAPHDWCSCTQVAPQPCLSATVIAGGLGHTCGVIAGSLQCWGANASGQLGNNSTNPTFQRVTVGGLSGAIQTVSGGNAHTCAIAGGTAWCWGLNNHGQLGDNKTLAVEPEAHTPVQVANLRSGVQAISAGEFHTCAILDGGAYCWGANNTAQLGSGGPTDGRAPVAVPGLGSGVQAIASGGGHTCALVNGAVWCWGDNSHGQVGDDNINAAHAPIQVIASGATAIGTGFTHSCAIVSGGVQCWGINGDGELGDGTNVPERHAPTPVPGVDMGVTALAVGRFHTCALLGGTVKCWGNNTSAELAQNPITVHSRNTPVTIAGIPAAQALFAGQQHTCALAGNQARCWGNNGSGQLGSNPDLGSTVNPPKALPQIVCTGSSDLTCGVVTGGCMDGSDEQSFGGGMVGCSGAVAYGDRATLCAPGYQPATSSDWVANRGSGVPGHDYWTDDLLRYNGNGPSACFVSTSVGTDCGSTTPMRVCTSSGTDAEGNACNWQHCGINATTPDQYFGGCFGNMTSGTLCIPIPPPQ